MSISIKKARADIPSELNRKDKLNFVICEALAKSRRNELGLFITVNNFSW
jgi:uncharacterized protein (DUF169 family)